MGDSQSFIFEANPAFGQYYMTLLTPLQSSQVACCSIVTNIIAKWFNIHQSEFQYDAHCA